MPARQVPGASLSAGSKASTRITSYNVCYTKLLRAKCDKHGETYYETDLFGDGTFRGACPQCQQEADARRAAEQAVIDARHAHAEA